jgi:hypothetical protein
MKRMVLQFGVFDYPNPNTISNTVTSPAHRVVSRHLATDSMILLQNTNNLLPLSKIDLQSIALIGVPAIAPLVHGDGSGRVDPGYTSRPVDAIRSAMGLPPLNNTCSLEVGVDYWQSWNPSEPASSPEQCCEICRARGDCLFFSYDRNTSLCFKKVGSPRLCQSSTLHSHGPRFPPVDQR